MVAGCRGTIGTLEFSSGLVEDYLIGIDLGSLKGAGHSRMGPDPVACWNGAAASWRKNRIDPGPF